MLRTTRLSMPCLTLLTRLCPRPSCVAFEDGRFLLHPDGNGTGTQIDGRTLESGEVVPLEVMRARLSTAIVTARQNLLQLPARIAPQLEGEPRMVIKAKLTQEVYAALAALSMGTNGNGNGSHAEPMGGDDGEHLTAPGPPASSGASATA
jgi:hypothetical protein